jgi:hypothetical protein
MNCLEVNKFFASIIDEIKKYLDICQVYVLKFKKFIQILICYY